MAVEVSVRRLADGSSPELLEGETIGLTEPNTSLNIQRHDLGSGTLFVSTKRLIWLSSEDFSKGWAFDYPSIALHAVSRDTSAFSGACIYCQIAPEAVPSILDGLGTDSGEDGSNTANGSASNETEDDSDEPLSDMRFVPANESNIDLIFGKISEYSALNPDDDLDDEGSDDNEGLMRSRLANQSGWIPEDEGLLDDAEEEDE